jgi:hypothetical protein
MTWLEGVQRLASVGGPFDPWLAPRLEMSFRPSAAPIDTPVAKLGGQPVWLDEPFWPVSASDGTPMTFVGQFPLPGPDLRMSYLFITQDEEATAVTFEPDAGENALIIQPYGRLPPFLTGIATQHGPALWRRGAAWTERIPVEVHIDLHPASEAAEHTFASEVTRQQAERRGVFLDPGDDAPWVECRSYVGGQPLFWQPTTTRIGPSWRFFFQLDGGEGVDDDAYALNFGGGTGYAFLSQDEREGRFCWDCV